MAELKAPNLMRDIASQTLSEHMSSAAALTLDTIFPPQSLITGLPVSGRTMESELWSAVNFLDEPCCQACGFPFEVALIEANLCGRCEIRRPVYTTARAAFAYDDSSRKLVLDFKHGGRTAGLSVFAAHMARAGRAAIDIADVIIPVPLHPTRLWKRRYNQSTLLCRVLSKQTGIRFDPDMLKRVKRTETQGGKTVSGRRRNMSGAFAVRSRALTRVKGANIVLIDDVFTTGATLEACARALRKAGAKRIDAITLARVVKAARLPT